MIRRPDFFALSKNLAIPAIRAAVNVLVTAKMAVFGHSAKDSSVFRCQGCLFHFCEKSGLETNARGFQKRSSGRESASGG
jgi:hypothetical protein